MPKILLSAENIQAAFGERTVLDIDRFEVFDGDRIGLIGENGAGKTTFLKILSGEMVPDSGAVKRYAEVSTIKQLGGDEEGDIKDARLSSEYAAKEYRAGLSGGEKTRRRIAGALGAHGAILLADEPTSDLDADGVTRLSRHLKEYMGAIVLISHDRGLLNEICTSIVELEDGHLTIFPGNYQDYAEEKQRRREFQAFEYEQYRKEQGRLMSTIQDKKEQATGIKLPSRMGNSEARLHKRSTSASEARVHKNRKALESRLSQLTEKERPRDDPGIKMALGTYKPITSRVAVEVRDMTIRFGSVLLEGADARIPVNTRTALMGKNGCGKTTLLRRIVSGDPRIRISPGVQIGFFGQDHADVLDLNKTALDNAMEGAVYPQSDVRTVLARLNMRGDDVFKKVSVLSGGERAKVALAKLFVSDVNVLILDEPTNHLDIYSLEALEKVLSEYGGTLIFVSHDKAFVRGVATRLLMFEDRKLVAFDGGIDDYERFSKKSASTDDISLQITALEMRMAALAGRMSSPKKGDRPDQLMEEYEKVAAQWRALKGGA